MTKVMYKAEIFEEGDCFVGFCRELDVSSFGDTPQDAKASLQEAIKAFLAGCERLGTLGDVLMESGFEEKNDVWKLREHIIEEGIVAIPTHTQMANDDKKRRVLGLHPGSMRMSDDFDAPLSDEFWLGKS